MRIFGDCRESQIPRPLGHFKFDAPLLAAGYLTSAGNGEIAMPVRMVDWFIYFSVKIVNVFNLIIP